MFKASRFYTLHRYFAVPAVTVLLCLWLLQDLLPCALSCPLFSVKMNTLLMQEHAGHAARARGCNSCNRRGRVDPVVDSSTRATHSSSRHGSHAPPPRTAVPSPPCSRLTQRCRLARIPSRAGLASHTTCLPLACRLLHIIQCPGAQSCPTPWQIFAHNPGDAYNFSSSLPHDARPHDQGCRHSRDKQRVHRESRRR